MTRGNARPGETGPRSVHAVISLWADRTPDADAIGAPGRAMLSYAALREQVEATVRALRARGVGRSGRVVVALPQGPELAVATLGVAAGAIAAPMDPNGREADFDVLFADMEVDAAVVLGGVESAARRVAVRRGMTLIELWPEDSAAAGRYRIEGDAGDPEEALDFGGPDDRSLFLRTSGTTSRSKIVPLTHRQFLSAADNTSRAFCLTPQDRLLNPMPLFHGHGLVAGTVSSLMAGASVICTPRFEPTSFFGWLDEFEPTWYTAVPTIHQAILLEAPDHLDVIERRPLRFIRSASAFLPDAVRSELESLFGVLVTEGYGLSEALQLTNTPLDRERRKVGSLGLPDSSEVAIMDDSGALVGPGVEGEIVARGPVVMDGYLNRPEENREVFRNGWFRTGDLGYLDEDGHLYMTGRIKDTINRGGEKISPQEIDAALLQHPSVVHALAFGMDHPSLGEDVAAAVVLRPDADATADALRRFASERLDEFKVPRRIYIVPSIPSNATGKLLRREIARRVIEQNDRPEYRAPETDLERSLVAIWQDVLGIERVGVDDDFFELGGHSLLAARIAGRVRRELGLELSLARLFETPTVARLAEWLSSGDGARPVVRISAAERQGPAPLSYAQQRLWILDRLQPGSTAYNMMRVFRLDGELDAGILIDALREVVRRHESLRTTFSLVDGEPVQVVAPSVSLDVPVIDLSDVSADERHTGVDDLIAGEAETSFDLETGPLLRARMIRLSTEEHILVIAMHHVISDGWSVPILIRELSEIYAARVADLPTPLPELDVQYADYAIWQREHVTDDVIERQLDYWRAQLDGAPELIDLPIDRPRPAVASSRGGIVRFRLPDELVPRLRALCRRENVTMHQLLLATFHVLLSRYCRQQDVVTGTPTAGRTHAELEPLIGFFVNTLAIRSNIEPGDSFRDHLARVRQTTLAAYDHQDVPFERLVEALQPRRSRSYSPLFQVMFILQNNEREAWSLPGVTVTRIEDAHADARFDLTLSFEEGRDLAGSLIYRADLFEHETAERIAASMQVLLDAVAAAPDTRIADLPLMNDAERSSVVHEWDSNELTLPGEPACLHTLFERSAAAAPDAPALRCGDHLLTACELNERANRLAHRLTRLGVGPDIVVGLAFERGIDAIVGLLGILKAGGAYLPLDPSLPAERLVRMVQDSGAAAVVAQPGIIDVAELAVPIVIMTDVADEPVHDPGVAVDGRHLAYVIYTSGSTGLPKGVAVEHRQVMNYVFGLRHRLELNDRISCATVSTLSADLGNTSVFTALAWGGCLHVIPHALIFNGAALADYFDEYPVDCLKITPSHLAALQSYGGEPARLLPRRILILGGEASREEWVQSLAAMAPGCTIFNHYGPTETTIGVLTYRATRGSGSQTAPSPSGTLRLGRPLPNVRAYIVDASLAPVPRGVAGELLIGGACVARGYLGRPELTAERFIPNPFGPGRVYRTGDLVRYGNGGDIEFLGRIDDQVKIRGFRVEPGEIEKVLLRHPRVKSSAVVPMADASGTNTLVAYVVADGVDTDELRSYARRTLPEYMVPSAFVELERIPLSPNGKIDRRALPAPVPAATGTRTVAAPRDETERTLVALFRDALGVDDIGIDDNFFEIGGHSLLAIRLFARITASFEGSSGLDASVLWDAPTIRDLAPLVSRPASTTQNKRLLVEVQRGDDRPPLAVVAGDWDGLGFYVRNLARGLDAGQPVYALLSVDLTAADAPRSFEEIAARYVALLRAERPHGPYVLSGYSASGLIALEMARQLRQAGEQVSALILIDTIIQSPRWRYMLRAFRALGRVVRWDGERVDDAFITWRYRVLYLMYLRRRGMSQVVRYYMRRLKGRPALETALVPDTGEESDWREHPGMEQFGRLKFLYMPQPYEGTVTLISPREGNCRLVDDPTLGWRRVAKGVRVLTMPGNHSTCLQDHIAITAEHFRSTIDAVRPVDSPSTYVRSEPYVGESIRVGASS